MGNINKYYEKTSAYGPNRLLKYIVEEKNLKWNALDIGCVAGRDTMYLLSKRI